MKRYPEGRYTIQSGFCCNLFALGMTIVQQLPGVLVPQRFCNAEDKFVGQV